MSDKVIDQKTQYEFDSWLMENYSFDEVIGMSAATLGLKVWAYRDELECDAIRIALAMLTSELADSDRIGNEWRQNYEVAAMERDHFQSLIDAKDAEIERLLKQRASVVYACESELDDFINDGEPEDWEDRKIVEQFVDEQNAADRLVLEKMLLDKKGE